jgi:peptide/nickel transport system substrate-binding protein
LARNDTYFKGAPYVDQVILHIIPDNSVRAVGLESGDLDLIQSPLSGADVKRLKTEAGIHVTQTTGLGITYLNINNSDPILSDVKVRRAIAMLIDRKTIAETIYEGMDQPGVSSLLPGTWWYTDTVKGIDYDPAKAQQLLAEAGWTTKGPDGILVKDGKPLRLRLTTYNDPNRMQVAQFLADSFKKAGIAADVGISECAPFNAEVMASKHQLAIIGWLLLVDPDRAFYRQFAPDGDANWEKYTNPKVTELLTQARTITDRDKRAALYAEAAQIIVNDAPYAYITTQGYVCAYRDRVQGYTVNRSQSIKALEHTWLSK